jgi:hypothetical protein
VSSFGRLALMVAAVGTVLLAPVTTASAATFTWTVMPAQQDATADYLSAVSCPSASFCMALGVQGPIPLAFAWNGSTWSLPPNTPGEPDESYVNGISCVSASFCMAVGYNFLGSSSGDKAAAWTWNGSRWSEITASSPSKWDWLYAVKCLSASACEAVGDQSASSSSGAHWLAEAWDGSTWSTQPVTGTVTGTPNAVACASAARCEAVGDGLAVGWNGTTWSGQKLPAVAGITHLNGVSCYGTMCTAVGTVYPTSGSASTLAEVWNGSRWVLQSAVGSGNVQGATGTLWNGVHCVSSANCTVVGSWGDAAGNAYTLAETWNGHTWAENTTPSPGPGSGSITNDTLNALSCTPGTKVCTAVGYHGGSSVVFAERR